MNADHNETTRDLSDLKSAGDYLAAVEIASRLKPESVADLYARANELGLPDVLKAALGDVAFSRPLIV